MKKEQAAYCPNCQLLVDSKAITFEEKHELCGCPVISSDDVVRSATEVRARLGLHLMNIEGIQRRYIQLGHEFRAAKDSKQRDALFKRMEDYSRWLREQQLYVYMLEWFLGKEVPDEFDGIM